MVNSCAAFNCTSRWKKGSDISFHKFPLKNPELLKKWVIATKRKNFVPTRFTSLCSKHFTPEDYEPHIYPNQVIKRLKQDAVPTKFQFPGHMQQPTPKKRKTINRNLSSVSPAMYKPQYKPPESTLPAADNSYSTSGVQLSSDVHPQSCSTSAGAEASAIPETPNSTTEQKKIPSTPTKVRLRRKIKILQQRLKRRERKIKTMKDVIILLKEKVNAPVKLLELLEENFSGFPLELIVHTLKNKNIAKCKKKYSEKMKEFALTLYFYSPKAYSFLRNNNFSLPNPSTLRKWVASFKCMPGFLQEVFQYLKENVSSSPCLKDVNLVFDAMSIRKQIIYDNNVGKNFGYVNLGNEFNGGDSETLATEALVFQIVALRGNFKCAVGYFFIDKISSEVLSKLVKMCILKLFEVGVRVHNVTFDGTSSNITAMRKLGCELPARPFFYVNHNGMDHKVTIMLDACHMLKLARNTLADMGTIESETGIIDFRFLQRLNSLQNEEGLSLANKLSDKHIFYRNRKMNVKLAAQTLSSSVADALEFLLKKRHPDFIGCEPTIEFLRIIDQLFDLFNSRDPFGKHFKTPIRKENLEYINGMLEKCLNYLSGLKIERVPILKHARKTFALGFITNIHTINILITNLLEEHEFKYILTYKFSQDHLELLFSCIRSRGGNNNNPNVKQFQWALRKLMFRNSVQPSDKGNCLSFDFNHQSSVMSFNELSQVVGDSDEADDADAVECMSNMLEGIGNSSYYKDNALYYICGFIIRKLNLKLNCEQCSHLLVTGESNLSPYTHFTDLVSKGKLIRASPDVLKIVKFMHNQIVSSSKDWHKLDTSKIIVLACRTFAGNVFLGHKDNNGFGEDSHEMNLIKLIGILFNKIICHSISKRKSAQASLSKLGVRQKLNKIILFSNV